MPRPKGSKNRVEGPSAPCPVCFKMFKVQGMGTHLREAHQIVYGSKTKLPVSTAVGYGKEPPLAAEMAVGHQKFTSSMTPLDLCILKGRLHKASMQEKGPRARLRSLSFVDKIQLVKLDFEKRFHIPWATLMSAYPDHFPDNNIPGEGSAFADYAPYAQKEYSRQREDD